MWFHESGPSSRPRARYISASRRRQGFGGFPGHSTDPQISGSWPDLILPRTAWSPTVHLRARQARAHLQSPRPFSPAGQVGRSGGGVSDGRYELINKLDWAHRWHVSFLYEDDAMPLLPRGTTVIANAVFDNTADNPSNPDPDQWVMWGSRTVDEMSHFRYGVTWFDDEADFRASGARARAGERRARTGRGVRPVARGAGRERVSTDRGPWPPRASRVEGRRQLMAVRSVAALCTGVGFALAVPRLRVRRILNSRSRNRSGCSEPPPHGSAGDSGIRGVDDAATARTICASATST